MEWLIEVNGKRFFVLTENESITEAEYNYPQECSFDIDRVFLIDEVTGKEVAYNASLKEMEEIELEVSEQLFNSFKNGKVFH